SVTAEIKVDRRRDFAHAQSALRSGGPPGVAALEMTVTGWVKKPLRHEEAFYFLGVKSIRRLA
ncbi:MAG TPA: hypothetical protein VFK30_13445, partial [Anaerolineae bacterium]|nr:hypothetical protein [Anaerolineae bacterium]